MRVGVDEAGRQEQALGVDHLGRVVGGERAGVGDVTQTQVA